MCAHEHFIYFISDLCHALEFLSRFVLSMVRVPFDFIARGAVPVACIFGLSRPIPVSGVVFRESHPQSVFMVNEAALNVDRNPFRKLAQSYNNSVYRPLLVCFALFFVIVAISFLIFRYELFH